MASYSPAIRRIRYLIEGTYDYASCRGWEKGSPGSPATINGGPECIRSYALPIAWRDGSDYIVTNERNSPTTNRHISAAHCAMTEMGYDAIASEVEIINRRRPNGFYEDTPIAVTRYRKNGAN